MARTRARTPAKGPSETPTVHTAPPLRRSIRSTRASQPTHDDASDEDESFEAPKKMTSKNKHSPTQPQAVTPDQSPPAPRYNTRSKQVQSSEPSKDAGDEESVEGLPLWPRYKDDLPNAFNGEVDPSLDFISKAPVEIIDNILSFLILDHEPELEVQKKQGNYKTRPHVLVSMSAMSRLFYHATEGFAHKFLKKNKKAISAPWFACFKISNPELYQSLLKQKKEAITHQRRSPRLASKSQLEPHKVCRTELLQALQSKCAICLDRAYAKGKFANLVALCAGCEQSVSGPCLVCQLVIIRGWYNANRATQTLTEALKDFDLRDYILLKSRKPGPRATFLDLPQIPYSTQTKGIGFPVFGTVTSFTFRHKDVDMIARLVHGDVETHMKVKRQERYLRERKARRRRVREAKVAFHEVELEVSTGKSAERHEKGMFEFSVMKFM